MSKSFWLYLSVVLNACLLSIVISYHATTTRLLAVNDDLLNAPEQPEAPHDVPILVSQNPKTGHITVYVYGLFPHTYAGTCRAQTPFEGAL